MPKITFIMTFTNRDKVCVPNSVYALKSLYPTATVLTIEDKPRLKLPQFQGQWTERWMQAAIATNPDIIVKVDPDTRAVKVATFPTTDIFGQTSPVGTYFPQSSGILLGGAIGFTAAAVKAILASGLLRNAKYGEKPYACEERRYQPKEMIVLQDPIIHDIAQQLKLTEGPWPGLHLKMSWEADQNEHPADATFIHPVKK